MLVLMAYSLKHEMPMRRGLQRLNAQTQQVLHMYNNFVSYEHSQSSNSCIQPFRKQRRFLPYVISYCHLDSPETLAR